VAALVALRTDLSRYSSILFPTGQTGRRCHWMPDGSVGKYAWRGDYTCVAVSLAVAGAERLTVTIGRPGIGAERHLTSHLPLLKSGISNNLPFQGPSS
jgi:hypothetical protein